MSLYYYKLTDNLMKSQTLHPKYLHMQKERNKKTSNFRMNNTGMCHLKCSNENQSTSNETNRNGVPL